MTLYRLSGPRALMGWKVLGEVFTDSDHNYVEFRISDGTRTRLAMAEGWSIRRLAPEETTTWFRKNKTRAAEERASFGAHNAAA